MSENPKTGGPISGPRLTGGLSAHRDRGIGAHNEETKVEPYWYE